MYLFIVDAFSKTFFGGNAAGVVIYSGELDEVFAQKLAAELKYSETAFVKELNKNTFSLRYFTPNSEVDLCGHATVAAFTVLKHLNLARKDGDYTIITKAGTLSVLLNDDYVMLEQAPPVEGAKFENQEDLDALCSCLGIPSDAVGDASYCLIPQVISTGLKDIMLPVKDKHILHSINPDFKALSNLSTLYEVVGVHAFTLDSQDALASCRNFAPLYGIDEESATGTSNGALTYYLYKNNVISPSSKAQRFIQGEKMNRPSEIITKLYFEGSLKILVGGNAKIISAGTILL